MSNRMTFSRVQVGPERLLVRPEHARGNLQQRRSLRRRVQEIQVERRQEGCLGFGYVAWLSRSRSSLTFNDSLRSTASCTARSIVKVRACAAEAVAGVWAWGAEAERKAARQIPAPR
jgi:hypothetical protein